MKNLNYTTGNRTSDLPTWSAVPQPTAPPRVPYIYNYFLGNEVDERHSESCRPFDTCYAEPSSSAIKETECTSIHLIENIHAV